MNDLPNPCRGAAYVKLELDARQILQYPWFKGKMHWEKEIRKMMKDGFKMEGEAMISKGLSYLTEEYVPRKLRNKKEWLD